MKIECFMEFSRDSADIKMPERYHYIQHAVSVLSRISNYLVKMKVFSVKVFQILSSKIYDLTIAHNFDDPRSQGPITSRSLLNPYTRASLHVVVHTFAMNTMIQFQSEIPEKFAEICSLSRTNRNSLCEKLAIFPLRLFSSALINNDCIFSSNVDLSRSLASIFYDQNLSIQGAPLFSAIQILYGLSEKEQFVANIAELFGLASDYDFWFLWMLGRLMFDRISLSGDHQQLEMLQAVTHLRRRPMSLTELHSEMKNFQILEQNTQGTSLKEDGFPLSAACKRVAYILPVC